ncbi:MAG TPA: ribonuclease P protein component [Thermoanaerobaculia bacterium]|nr:ribonuclease P protein component [Thermoanaerobaculia bacterium]
MPLASKPAERLPRSETLRRTADYRLCYRDGARRHGPLATLYSRVNSLALARLGVTAARKVGGAVVRNRLKRWTREEYRRWPRRRELAGLDLVVHFKPAAREATHVNIAREIDRLFAETLQRRSA